MIKDYIEKLSNYSEDVKPIISAMVLENRKIQEMEGVDYESYFSNVKRNEQGTDYSADDEQQPNCE